MARINIEESLFKDVRFDDLKMKLGSVDTALGAMVRAWSLAQQWYLKEETSRLIPVSEWKKQRINDSIIEVGLAEIRGDFVYVSGSDEQFAWLIQRREAGKKGGRPSNATQSNREKVPVSSVKVPVPPESGSNPLSLSLSLPLSPSLSLSTNSSSDFNTSSKMAKKRSEVNTELNKKIWASYEQAYRERYKVDPVRNVTVNGQVSQLGKRLGQDAIDVVSFYLRHNDGFYIKQIHPIGLCLKDAEGLRTQMLRGRAITSSDVREFEKTDSFREQLKRFGGE